MTMHRDLNPRLFGNPAGAPNASQDTFGSQGADPRTGTSNLVGGQASSHDESQRRVPYPPVDLKAMETHIATLKGALIQMDRRTETIAFKMEELARTVHARLERFSQSIVRVEDSMNKNQGENSQRFATMSARVNERKVADMKVQELMDRHNAIIRNFENRMHSLQRLVSEQEMSLHNSQAALDEARSELSRLKR